MEERRMEERWEHYRSELHQCIQRYVLKHYPEGTYTIFCKPHDENDGSVELIGCIVSDRHRFSNYW
jgi:hypothetical protein